MDKTSLYELDTIQNELIFVSLKEVYRSLETRGYNPISQIIGYLITGDPGYITSFENARDKITSLNREEILEVLLKNFMRKNIWNI